MVHFKVKYYSWKDVVEDLQSKDVNYIGWANGGAKPTKVLLEKGGFENPIEVKHEPFSNTGVYYYPLANEVMCVDMS